MLQRIFCCSLSVKCIIFLFLHNIKIFYNMQEPTAKEIFCFCLFVRNIHHILCSRKPRKLYIFKIFYINCLASNVYWCVCVYIVKALSGEYLTLQNIFYVVSLFHILNISKVDKKINLELEIIIITIFIINLYYASIEIFTKSMMMILIIRPSHRTNKQTNT
jgi:hypothetical protein